MDKILLTFRNVAARVPGGFAWIAAAIWLAALPIDSAAQSYTATLQGVIQDSSRAVMPGVRLTLVNEATNVRQETRSNERGAYLFLFVPPGRYRLTAETQGFRTFMRSGIELQVQQQATVDVTMEPGDVSTTIEVTGETPRLNAVDATIGRVVDNKAILDLPVNVMGLLALTPGAVMMPNRNYWTLSNFSGNGTRNANADILLDGVSVAIADSNGGTVSPRWTPSRDIIQEFKLQTNSFSAEYGSSGGSIVNIVLESGTNELHGRLYEYLSHYKLNANNFFSNRNNLALNPTRKSVFGGVAGGPVYLPKVYDGRNRTFFFFSTEWMKESTQSTVTHTVPTARQIAGDFSETFDAAGRLMPIFNPFDVSPNPSGTGHLRAPFPGNVIPKSIMDPAAVNVVKFYPAPTSDGVQFTRTSNFYGQAATTNDSIAPLIKIDHNFNERQRLSGRYSRYAVTNKSPNYWGEGNWMFLGSGGYTQISNTGQADYLHVLNPSTTLNLRWGVFRYHERRVTYGEEHGSRELGFNMPVEAALPPLVYVEGYTTIGPDPANHLLWGSDIHHFLGNVTTVRGSHTIKAGAEARAQRMNMGQPGVDRVSFNFGRAITMQDPLRSNSQQGNALASLLLGWGSGTFMFDSAPAGANQAYGFFITDDIRVNARLTLNLGLRYELDPPYTERYNRLSWFNPTIKSPLSVPQYPDLRGGVEYTDAKNRTSVDADNNNWAPRVGFAYRVGSETVVRGGYGIYYGQSQAGPTKFLGSGFAGSVGWISSRDSNLTLNTPLSNPFPYGLTPPPGSAGGLLTFVGGALGSQNTQIRSWGVKPYFQQWSLSVQRQLPFNSVVEILYSGSRGVHLGYGSLSELNRIDPQYWQLGDQLSAQVANPFYGIITDTQRPLSAQRVALRQTLLPYPQYTSVGGYYGPPIANSIYHSGTVQFTKRFSHGLNFNAHYTLSKNIDDTSYSGNNGWWGGGTTGVQSYHNLRLERAVSVLDHRHRGVVDFNYTLPIGRGKAFGTDWARAVDWMLGGWQINGILTVQSGRALQPALQSGNLPSATQRPNWVRDATLSGPITDRLNLYLDPNAFSRPAPYTLGNAPRTIDGPRAPGIRTADFSIFKQFHFSESRYVQIRAEASNVTNTPCFGTPNTTVGATNFGVITSQVVPPRSIQAALKIYF